MSKVRFNVDINTLEIGTLIDLEDLGELQKSGKPVTRQLVSVVSPFLVDEKGNPVPEDEALAACRKLTVNDLMQAFNTLKAAVESGIVSP